jgi:hypothetical protein
MNAIIPAALRRQHPALHDDLRRAGQRVAA